MNVSAQVTGSGTFDVTGFVSGTYDVTITGTSHVPHVTEDLEIADSTSLSFSVVPLGPTPPGVVIDETFQRFFHQLARVSTVGAVQLHKWVIPPTELYLVEGTVPDEQFEVVRAELERVNADVVRALWCNWVGPLKLTTGPDVLSDLDGRIVVRPNWDEGARGTVGPILVRSGRVSVNVYGPTVSRLMQPMEIRAILAHELFHVAGAFHVCGGTLGDNAFGFGLDDCPYPDSLMANRGVYTSTPSSEDRLAACLIYSQDTVPGNRYPDINPYYARR